MPPRKRTAAKPEEQQTTSGPEAEDKPDGSADTEEQPDSSDAPPEQAGTEDSPEPEKPDRPAKSDLQSADEPCSECMPNGWPEGAFSVGCTHGTWIRKK